MLSKTNTIYRRQTPSDPINQLLFETLPQRMREHQEQIHTLQAQLAGKEQIQADLLDRDRQLHELQEQVDTR